MYPQCRHVRPSGESCRAAAIKGSHWCYFHLRLHQGQAQRNLYRQRDRQGRFTPATLHHLMDTRPRQLPSPHHPSADPGVEATAPHSASTGGHRESSNTPGAPRLNETWDNGADTIDYGTMPVGEPSRTATPETTSLALPPIEDSASIQLALIDVLQALAANQLDPKRAGLLLYGLQVASTNAKDLHIHSNVVRSITYTEDGIPLAPQDYGWDIEDMEDDDEDEDDQDSQDDEDEQDEE
jgi:hypothetical protein